MQPKFLTLLGAAGLILASASLPALAGEFEDRLAEVEARYGPVTLDREVADQTTPEWMSVGAAQQAIVERDNGNTDEALRLIGMAANIATSN